MSDSNEVRVANWMDEETLAEYLEPLRERYDVKYRGHGIIYVDHEQYNIVTAQSILAGLSSSFGVSTGLIRSRLIELGWLNDVRSVSPTRDRVARLIGELESLVKAEPEIDEKNDQYWQ